MLINNTDALKSLENIALDACFQIRGQRSTDTKIYIVTIDDDSLKQLGKPFVQISPELARAILHLHDRGAKAIGVDLLIADSSASNPELGPGGVGDADEMARAVGTAKNVVLSQWIAGQEEPTGPFFQWLGSVQPAWDDVGFVDLTVDNDMCVRYQQLRAKFNDSVVPCFALAILGKALQLERQWVMQPTLVVDGQDIPIDNERLLVNYLGPPGTVARIPLHRVLAASESGPPLPEDLSDSIVLIGADMRTHQDKRATPFAGRSTALALIPTAWFGHKPALMTGVEIHANILATIMDDAYITTPFLLNTPLLLLVTGVVLGSTFVRTNLETGAICDSPPLSDSGRAIVYAATTGAYSASNFSGDL